MLLTKIRLRGKSDRKKLKNDLMKVINNKKTIKSKN